MKQFKLLSLSLVAFAICLQPAFGQCPTYLNTEVRLLHSEQRINLCERFAGQPLLIVNTASHCGYTYQFKELEQLHQRYKTQGLAVIGFPSNDFRQEANDEAQTAKVCHINYGVKFTMTAPVSVTGESAHPVFRYLSEKAGPPRWNFFKYLVSADGQKVIQLPSQIEPGSQLMNQSIRRVM